MRRLFFKAGPKKLYADEEDDGDNLDDQGGDYWEDEIDKLDDR